MNAVIVELHRRVRKPPCDCNLNKIANEWKTEEAGEAGTRPQPTTPPWHCSYYSHFRPEDCAILYNAQNTPGLKSLQVEGSLGLTLEPPPTTVQTNPWEFPAGTQDQEIKTFAWGGGHPHGTCHAGCGKCNAWNYGGQGLD